jgi:hypothetical protein
MRISGGRQSYTCWRLGFRQYSFNHIARVPQHPAPAHGHGRCFPGMLLSPSPFGSWVSHQTQEYPPNSSRLNREYSKAPRGAVMSLCTSIPATRSCSTFTPATSRAAIPVRTRTKRAARQSPGQKQDTDTRSRRGSGGYPARGSGANLSYGHERSTGGRPRRAARTTRMHLLARRHRPDPRGNPRPPTAGSPPAAGGTQFSSATAEPRRGA